MKVYTRRGDDGSTDLFGGGRVSKDDPRPTAYGHVDEAQAAIGLARAAATDELAELLVGLEADLWVVMAELATNPERLHLLEAGTGRSTTTTTIFGSAMSKNISFGILKLTYPQASPLAVILALKAHIIAR